MSVLIKGENVPTSCRTCRLKMNCDDCEGHEFVCVPLHRRIGHWDDLLTDKRRGDCPLVPVPSHGRLVDADALEADLDKRWNVSDCQDFCNKEVWLGIHDAPTVIPAE